MTTEFNYAYGTPIATGLLKREPQDFFVSEVLGYSLSGQGEHQYLFIEKMGLNTQELIKEVAKSLNVSEKMVSYAGLKDKYAKTQQWIGVHVPGKYFENLGALKGNDWKVLEYGRHHKKLKIGNLSHNIFKLVLRDISHLNDVINRLEKIKSSGVPNYFGEQRFGHQNQNLDKARALLFENKKVKSPFLKGMYYSSARSFLFNHILSLRVKEGFWNVPLSGDVMQLNGSHSIFGIDVPDETIIKRVLEHDISPAAPLWGRGENLVRFNAKEIENQALAPFHDWCEALEAHGLERAYRPLILALPDLNWSYDNNDLTLSFSLPAGAYATGVVRELIQ